MFSRILPIIGLFFSFIILCLGNSLQSVLLPARATLAHFSDLEIGMMMSGYYAGFIGGTFVCAWLIGRVGHIRIFASAAAGACAIMLLHALFVNPFAWIILRVVYGLCLVQLFTVMESWLNSIGDKQTRGKIISVYMISNFISSSLGQLLFFLAPAEGFELFSFSAILLSLSLFPLMLSRIEAPALMQAPKAFGLKELYRISPLGIYGALTAGFMAGAYWGLTAVYILGLGFPQGTVAWFLAASLMGGLFAQWPLGALSDRINRRFAILLSLALMLFASVMLGIIVFWDMPQEKFGLTWIIGWAIIFGAGFHPFYSLCMAHANDFVPAGNFVQASASLQLIQSVGAVVGPLIAGMVMHAFGSNMLVVYIAALTVMFMVYTTGRILVNRVPFLSKPFRILTQNAAIAQPTRG